MKRHIAYIASNTFREAVRDRVLVQPDRFALLISGRPYWSARFRSTSSAWSSINLGLDCDIFVRRGHRDIHRDRPGLKGNTRNARSTPCSRKAGAPLGIHRRQIFRPGRHADGQYVFHGDRGFRRVALRVAPLSVAAMSGCWSRLYFIVLQFLMVTALALLFSSFSSPLCCRRYSRSHLFVIGSFAEDLRGFAAITQGAPHWLAVAAAYLVPNFSALNV